LEGESNINTNLSLWEDTPTKKAILDFVAEVTNPSSPDYVLPEERIATFDNDGTLWCEQPTVQGDFIMQRLAAMAKKDPSLRKTEPWQAAYTQDYSWLQTAITKHYDGDDSDVKVLMGAVLKAFSAMTVDFFKTARHPKYHVSYLEVAYQPMVELLGYLEANGFTTYIVSGGGRDFMRPITQQVYGIPPERVVGSAPDMSYKDDAQGSHIMRGTGLDIFDDGSGKAVNIWDRIGRRPILAAGKANGDIPMLQYAGSKDHPTLRLLVHHDDAKREFAYTAGAGKAVKLVQKQGWTEISMKNDWKQVFSFQGGGQ
jgi:phosphoglycolate phosphatase-like HAD superfamily hydrolase